MRNPSATRIAFRHLVAGGSSFQNFGKGTDPKAVFRKLVEDALHERGHGGYSGTISEKSGFSIRSRTPMSRQQAYDFVDKDIDKSDKWGPAFAVPVAESKVKWDKEIVLNVKAQNQDEAWQAFKDQIQAEKGMGLEFSPGTITKVKSGGLPTMTVTPASDKKYIVIRKSFHYGEDEKISAGSTKSEAINAFKTMILASENFVSRLKPGTLFYLQEVKDLKAISVTGESSKLPMWEVKGRVLLNELGPIEGWLFYGIASS